MSTTNAAEVREDDPEDAETIRTLREAAAVFFARPGPRLMAAAAGTSWTLRLLAGPPGPLDVVAAGAAIAWWPFQEWILHKYVLHMKPIRIGEHTIDPDFARTHREHHAKPRRITQTLLPVGVIAGAIPFAGAGWWILLGGKRAALTGMATYSTMALLYEWTHLLVHTGYLPSSAFAKKVRRNHRLHHWRNEHYWYGFTLPLVDRVLGTDPDPASVPRSSTATDLHGMSEVGTRS